MEITARALWTLIHGMAFGGLYLLVCSGALVGLYQFTTSSTTRESTLGLERFMRIYLITMVVLVWAVPNRWHAQRTFQRLRSEMVRYNPGHDRVGDR